MSAWENGVYRFADCELDPVEHRLLAHGQPVTLTPKVFDTLVLLVERAGHVISKDELMAALWPRGFVHESNLTKHIWLIRRALGDGEDESRYIETVPKLGYRFVASVQQVARVVTPIASVVEQNGDAVASPHATVNVMAPAGDATAIDHQWDAGRDAERRHRVHSAESSGQTTVVAAAKDALAIRRGDRWWLLAIGLVLIAALGGAYWWRTTRIPARSAMSALDPGAVAIVDFNNLSGNAKDAWLGPALEQMLATEVAANGKLHAVSEELVRPARADLPAPEAGGYAPSSLTTLQRRLGAHYVLSGAYLVSGPADTPRLRVDLAVQDTQSGATFASLSREAAVNELPGLVAQMGGELRKRFGEPPSNPVVLRQIAAAQPPTAEVARHVGFALQALKQYDPARARDELLQAVSQAPGYAPAYLYLSRAWAALGYRAKALAAAEQAAADARDLPAEERLQIDAQRADLQAATAQSIAIRQKLVDLRPQNLEYRLQLIDAQIAGSKNDVAESTLTAARKLPGLTGDPRLELAAVQIATARGDAKSRVAHAREALRLAQARGETGLIASSELQLGMALDTAPDAESTLRKAAADYRRIDNPHGEALAYQNLGNLFDSRNQQSTARENYQRAMTMYQGIGDLGGEAAIYDELSRMLWSAGDRDGTQAALREALRIGRETNDLVRQAWSLTGLATTLTDESAGDEAAEMYRQAIALDGQAGARSHQIFAQAYYADLLRMRGELDKAREVCTSAQNEVKASGDPSQAMTVDFECAQIDLDSGDVYAASATFTAIEKKAIAAKDTFNTANAQLMLGQIAMGRKQWNDARQTLQRSSVGWATMKETPGEATTAALLALCADALHDTTTRDKLAAQARQLRGSVTAHAEVFELDMALAELQAASGQHEPTMARLRGLAGDASKRNWVGLAFEARLAALRVLERGSDASAIQSTSDALVADARKAGYGWVVQRLATVSPVPTGGMRH